MQVILEVGLFFDNGTDILSFLSEVISDPNHLEIYLTENIFLS